MADMGAKQKRLAENGQSGFRALSKEGDIVRQPMLICDNRPDAAARRIRAW
jgi:hypothetical protein